MIEEAITTEKTCDLTSNYITFGAFNLQLEHRQFRYAIITVSTTLRRVPGFDDMTQEDIVPWIDTISAGTATGSLKRQYEAAIKRAGRIYGIVKIMSLSPETMRTSMGLYRASMMGDSPLSRAHREMLATVVSRANDCHY